MSNGDRRIVVEIFSHEEADRLRAEMNHMDELHRTEIQRLEARLNGLHQTFYEFLQELADKRKNR